MMGTDVAEIQKEGDTDKFRQERKGKGVNVRKAADGEARVATEAETVFENQRTMRREVLGSESSRSLRGGRNWFETRGRKKKSTMSPEVSKGGLEARGTRRIAAGESQVEKRGWDSRWEGDNKRDLQSRSG